MAKKTSKNENDQRWDRVKSLIRLRWDKLSEREIEESKNDISQLVSSVQDCYRASRAVALREVTAFREKILKRPLEEVALGLKRPVA